MDGAPYPGADASPYEIYELAGIYYNAASHLFGQAQHMVGGEWQLPARLCAIHSIELYLNAYLRFRGEPAAKIRGRHHELWHTGFADVLRLRKKTSEHLKWMSDNREYLVVRYAPDQRQTLSQSNRMLSTLVEIMTKSNAIPV
ncbi:hypothetical protein [Hasllibacter sp. MH4015]|uniref:hypothetical protein n=1 Tax=Hasllibacter sp. MH4015 TaxID=2854029 RepID=UPI001CD75839|nr:hypothetical protein [Hasllibacter sp. MH4015]